MNKPSGNPQNSKSLFGTPKTRKIAGILAVIGILIVVSGPYIAQKLEIRLPGQAENQETPLEELFEPGKEPVEGADQCENPTLLASEIGDYCKYEYVQGSTKTPTEALKTLETGFRKAEVECARIQKLEEEGKVVEDADQCRLYQTYSQEFLSRYSEALTEKDRDDFKSLRDAEKDSLRTRIINLILNEQN